MNVSSVKNLNGEVLSAVQDASLTNVIQTNSGNWQDITAYQNASATYLTEVSIPESATWNEVSTTVQTNSAQWGQGGTGGDEEVNALVHSNSGTWNEVSDKVDTTALTSIVDSSTISYISKPTNKPIYASANYLSNVNGIVGKGLIIEPSNSLQVNKVITAWPNWFLEVPNIINANKGGITAVGLSATRYSGFSANGITANASISGFSANGIKAGKPGPLCIEGTSESISSVNGAGFTFSSQNPNFGTANLTIANSNSLVQIPSPKFEARNISGAGFSIEASGAKGYDENGNVVWDTYSGVWGGSGDVFPPTNNLEPQTTYYLGWNANNGGLFWYHP